MVQFLLSAGEKISQISDLIGDKWGEILGWISIPTAATTLIACIFKLITAGVSKKIASKNIKPLANKVTEAKDTLLETVNKVEKLFDEKLQKFSVLVESKIAECFKEYSRSKQIAFDKIVNGEQKIQEVLQKVEAETIKLESIAEEIQKAETVEDIEKAVEPIIKEQEVIVETKEETDTDDALLR